MIDQYINTYFLHGNWIATTWPSSKSGKSSSLHCTPGPINSAPLWICGKAPLSTVNVKIWSGTSHNPKTVGSKSPF